MNKDKTRVALIWRCGWLINDVVKDGTDCSDVTDNMIAFCARDLTFTVPDAHLDNLFLRNEIVVLI